MSATFTHAMPFGAALRDDGVRFRLWAPGQRQVSLLLDGRDEAIPMNAEADGWFDLTSADAQAGSRYHFQLDDGQKVPDPISRFQPDDVHGPSLVVDPRNYAWRHPDWQGRPWHETVLYELHVGAFSEDGTYDGLRRKLDYLVGLGVSAVELMPLSDFLGMRNWGYDGVLPFAPDASYGSPDQLKLLIDEIHGRGLMAFLDVVYNHFGPEGNYLSLYAPDYFDPDEHTPWGAAINYKQRTVRDVAIHNVLYWLEEYRFDGLRFDAVDRIVDHSEPPILEEIALAVRQTIPQERHVHLVLENDANEAHLLERKGGRPVFYDAQWNDDIHHVYHHLLTEDSGGYYRDYVHEPHRLLARALATGFVYQGEPSEHRDGAVRGAPSGHLPPTAFVAFLQNHDQIGNRAFGERIADLAPWPALKAMQAVLLLAPNVPLLFMGEEWGATQPFCFFTDFHDALADAVREGRRREFKKFPQFADEAARAAIPDPNDVATFVASRLDWSVPEEVDHADWLAYTRDLLRIRREQIVPLLPTVATGGTAEVGGSVLQVAWPAGGRRLILLANLAAEAAETSATLEATLLFESEPDLAGMVRRGGMPPWSVLWQLASGQEPGT
jgi:maltooligosyltrehalose trehalohydrolase